MRITYIVIERSGLRFNCIENSCKSWFSFDLVRVQCYSILGKNNGKWKIEVNRDRSLNLKRREREDEKQIRRSHNTNWPKHYIFICFNHVFVSIWTVEARLMVTGHIWNLNTSSQRLWFNFRVPPNTNDRLIELMCVFWPKAQF